MEGHPQGGPLRPQAGQTGAGGEHHHPTTGEEPVSFAVEEPAPQVTGIDPRLPA